MGKYNYYVYANGKEMGIERRKRREDEDSLSGSEDYGHNPYSPEGIVLPGSQRRSEGSGTGSQQMIGSDSRGMTARAMIGGGIAGGALPGVGPSAQRDMFPAVGGSRGQESQLLSLQQQRASQIQTMLVNQQEQRINASIPHIPGMTVGPPLSTIKFKDASSRKLSKNSRNLR